MNIPSSKHEPSDQTFTDRLQSGLAEAATGLPDPAGPAHAARRAHDRRRNRRAVAGAFGVIALVSGATALSLRDSTPDADIATASQPAEIDRNGVEFDWSSVDDGLSYVRSSSASTDGGLYALSTAPGTRFADFPDGNAPRALYRLDDDGRWTPIPLDEDDPDVAAFSQRGSSLYALSTAAATGEPLGSISTDGGGTWSSVGLGTIAPPSDQAAWTLASRVDVASTDDATLAVVSRQFHLDADQLFPELRTDDPADGGYYSFDTSPEGVSLLRYEAPEPLAETPDPARATALAGGESPAPTVVRTVTWAALGVDGPESLAVPTATYVVDGETWTPVDNPVTEELGSQVRLQGTDDEFVLSENVSGDKGVEQSAAYRSTDGVAWTPVTLPTPDGQLASVGDALVHVSSEAPAGQQSLRVSRDGGATWTVLDVASLDDRIQGEENDALDPRGQWFLASGGPLGLALTVNIPDGDGDGVDSLLLFSTDLQSWSVTDLADVSPESVTSFGQAMVGTDRVVVPAFGRSGDADTPGETITVVGTPIRG